MRNGGNSKYRGLRGKAGSKIRELRKRREGTDCQQPCKQFCEDFSFASVREETSKAYLQSSDMNP